MHRKRVAPLATALLAVLALGFAAAALRSMAIDTGVDTAAPSGGTGGASLLAVLALLFFRVLGLLGVETGAVAPSPAFSTGSLIDLAIAAVPFAAALVGATLLGVVLVAARRRLPQRSVLSALPLPGPVARNERPERRRRETEREWPPASPTGGVAGHWLAMVERIDAESPRSRTPGEWADAAREAGLDAAAVRTITRTFRTVRYGSEVESDEHRRRASRAADALERDP